MKEKALTYCDVQARFKLTEKGYRLVKTRTVNLYEDGVSDETRRAHKRQRRAEVETLRRWLTLLAARGVIFTQDNTIRFKDENGVMLSFNLETGLETEVK